MVKRSQPQAPRRANDAQVERLLTNLKSLEYRQELAHKIADREGIEYKSAMRRLQRYVTEGEEKRSFVSSPAPKQRIVRQEARAVEIQFSREREPEPRYEPRTTTRIDYEREHFPGYDVTLADLRAITAYHDGDITETAERLNLSPRGENLLDLAVTNNVDVLERRGGGEIADAVRDFYEELASGDYQDIQDFHDLLMNLSDWQINVVIDAIVESKAGFAEWLDAFRDDGFSLDDITESEFWALFREVYGRKK